MKLLTHNMLACHIKGVKNNYPFKIEVEEVVEREADFDPGERGVLRGPAHDHKNLAVKELSQTPVLLSIWDDIPQGFLGKGQHIVTITQHSN